MVSLYGVLAVLNSTFQFNIIVFSTKIEQQKRAIILDKIVLETWNFATLQKYFHPIFFEIISNDQILR